MISANADKLRIETITWFAWLMANRPTGEILEKAYGREPREKDPYMDEKRELLGRSPLRWWSTLDPDSRTRLMAFVVEVYGSGS